MELDLSSGGTEDRVKLYIKCKLSPLYFIENFVSVDVAGGFIAIKDSDLWFTTPKYRQLVAGLYKFENVSFVSSRQHAKTTTVLMYLLWAMLFHSNLQIEFITLDSRRATDAIRRMKGMLERLPSWLRMPFKGTAERVTFMELENGSRINSSYVSGSIDPDRLGRGLSAPIIFFDEAAFVPKMDILATALIPAMSAARVFAKENNFPTCFICTSTPNGASTNWFYNTWIRGTDSKEVFEDETIKIKEDYQEIIDKDPEKNKFVNFRIHWSETGKDEIWYRSMVKDLGFNYRKISQELDLVFLGSSNAVFPDEVLEKFEPQPITSEITMAYGEKFKLTQEIDPNRTYLLGVDSAATRGRNSDWSALFLMDAITGEEVGSWHGRFSVIKRYAVVVKSLIQGLTELHGLTEDSLIVIIERNSFGLGVVEELLYDDNDFDYTAYVYYEIRKNGDRIPGLTTTAVSRDVMFNLLLSSINEMPARARSGLYQEELRNLEQKNSGKFEASSGAHDDVIMAGNFCLYVRADMIKEGTIVVDGRVNKFDIKRASYFLDATMSQSEVVHRVSNLEKETYEVINNDEESDRKRILAEMGLTNNYEKEGSVSNSIVFGLGL